MKAVKKICALACGITILATALTSCTRKVDLDSSVTDKYTKLTLAKAVRNSDENNPIVTNSFTADPYAMVYNGRVYVYMTNDQQQYDDCDGKNKNGYSSIESLRIISSADMVNWTDCGTVDIASKDGLCSWANVSWAPCATWKKINGKDKFFLYFANGGYQIGVVTSDSPTGPFKDELGKELVGPDNQGTINCIDPAVMIDDDGTAYLTYGGGENEDKETAYPKTARIVKLGDDMQSLAGKPVEINAPYVFEDSGINKINGKYVFSYCSNWEARIDGLPLGQASIGYMTADKPLGPYTFKGDVLKNCGTVFGRYSNNHHCIVNFKGKYYMFYHTQVLEDYKNYKNLGYRSCQVNELTVEKSKNDVTLPTVEQNTTGVSQVGSFNPYYKVSGLTFCDSAGMKTLHSDGLYNGDITDGSWLYVKGCDFTDSSPDYFKAEFECSKSGTVIIRKDDKKDGEIIGCSKITPKNNKATINIPVSTITGKHDIYFEFTGEIKKFVSWQFTRK